MKRALEAETIFSARNYVLICLSVAAILVLASLLAPFNHDEDQYYAASHALSYGIIYRDFIFFQTPLNAIMGHVLMLLWPGQSLWLLRVSQALIGAAVFGTVLGTSLKMGARPTTAIFSSAMMLCCYSFLFATTLFRNDMLPTLFSTLGIAVFVLAVVQNSSSRHFERSLFLSGLLLALSASAKANFLIMCAAPVAWLMTTRNIPMREKVRLIAVLAAGGLVGAAPTLISFWLFPEQFWWQVVEFNAKAPMDWYGHLGLADRLTPSGRAGDALKIMVQGPGLLALIMVLVQKLKLRNYNGPDHHIGRREKLLDWFIIFGLIAAMIPNPAWRQYFIVPLPALFMRLPAILDSAPQTIRKAIFPALGLFACIGLGAWTVQAGKTFRRPEGNILVRWEESHWLGKQVQRLGKRGTIVSLSPHLIVDSGFSINLRFISGVFAYRWGGNGRDREIAAMGGTTESQIARMLAANPPAAIVTGYEGGRGNSFSVDMERPLRVFARRHGYRALRSPFGKATLHVRMSDHPRH